MAKEQVQSKEMEKAEEKAESKEKETVVATEKTDSGAKKEVKEDKTVDLEKRAVTLEEQLAEIKRNSKSREEEIQAYKKKLEETTQTLEQVKKKFMTKEELEAEEKRTLQKKNEELADIVRKLQSENHKKDLEFKKHVIATEAGIPSDLLSMVKGEDEDEIRLNCQKLSKHLKTAATPGESVETQAIEVGTEKVSGQKTDAASRMAQSGARPKTLSDVREAIRSNPEFKKALMEHLGAVRRPSGR